MEIMVARFVV